MHRQSPNQPYFKALRMAAADLTKPQARVALRYTRLAMRREPWNPGYAQILSTLYQKHPSLFPIAREQRPKSENPKPPVSKLGE